MNHSTLRRLFRSPRLSLVLAAACAVAASAPAAPVVLLTDSFQGTGTPNTGNLNYNLSGRQTGLLAPVPYTGAGNVQVGNIGEPHDGGQVLLCAFAANAAALDYNFNGARSAGGLRISFDLDPNAHNSGDLSNWGAVTLGSSEANRTTFVVSGTPHFGILFRANGGIQAFDGGSVVSGAETWAPPGNYSLQLHRFDIVITGPGDGNPFDGAGDTQIDVYADGGVAPVYSFTKVGGYADNFINFQSSDVADFDNMSITALNPPASPADPWDVFAWSADGDSDISTSYTYTHAYNFGSAASPVINGVTFTGVNGGNPSVATRFAVAGIPTNLPDDGGANVGGSSITLARSFIYGGNPGTLTVEGLTPGQSYVLTLYAKAWDPSGNRIQQFVAGGTTRVIDQDTFGRNDGARNGIRITYAYVADGSGTLTVTMSPRIGGNTFHFYGFSNRQGTPPPATAWNYSEWTSDATSGVTPSAHVYTHAQNLGSTVAPVINGLPFAGNGALNPVVSGSFAVANFGNLYGGGYVPTITGNGQALANQFLFNGNPGTLTVQGLVPGRRYVLSLYSAAFGGPGRIINFLADGDQQAIDQGAPRFDRGIVINYAYTAPPSGEQTVRMYTVNPGWSFHFCGFANREEAPATAPVFNAQPSDLIVALGSTGTFTAAVAGAAPLDLQWYFGPDPIPDATNATLNVFAEFPDVAGNYRLVASNGSGSATSRVATLTVRLPVAGLFNTGVDGSGAALADASVDPHYQIIINADSASPDAIVQQAGFPIAPAPGGPWLANTANSKWIGPRADTVGAAGQNAGGGLYVYRTTFDCTGLDLGTIIITGGWATDNAGLTIRVNGVDTPFTVGGFAALASFTLASSNATFIDGINTLDFVVRNDDAGPGYTGLRVGNLSGTASLPSTPPEITGQPQGATRGTGESHTFSAAYLGSSPLTFQWTHDGTNLPGASGPSLTLNNLVHANAGAYALTISSPFGTATSSNAVLIVRDSVPGLYNTGVDDARVALADDSVDPHYRLIQNADGPSPDARVEDSLNFPIADGPWVPNATDSKWIGPRWNTAAAAGGDYTYRATVDLTGFDPASIEITGEWATDNSGPNILVNGVPSGQVNTTGFTAYTPFRLTNGFTAGVNTLDFRVNNAAAGYTGLRVRGLRGLGTLLPPGTRPFIITQPADAVGNFNQTSTFTVLANGSAPLAYQWYFGVDPLPDATNASLSVLVEFPDVAGFYSVEISNAAGSTNSRMAELEINDPPVVPARGAATMQDTPATIATGKFLMGVTDPNGDSVSLDSVATASAEGGSILSTPGGYTYTPPSGFSGTDSFSFVVRDSRGGVASGTMVVLVVSGALPASNQVLLAPRPGGGWLMRFAGVPGRAYHIQRATTLGPPDWTTIATVTAPPHGIIEFEDATVLPSAFYRTAAAP